MTNGLRKAIDKAGSISGLARQIGVTHQAACRWVKKGFVPNDRAPQISKLYRIPVRDLIDPQIAQLVGG